MFMLKAAIATPTANATDAHPKAHMDAVTESGVASAISLPVAAFLFPASFLLVRFSTTLLYFSPMTGFKVSTTTTVLTTARAPQSVLLLPDLSTALYVT